MELVLNTYGVSLNREGECFVIPDKPRCSDNERCCHARQLPYTIEYRPYSIVSNKAIFRQKN